MGRQDLNRDPFFESMHLQWFGDPPPDPAPGEPAPGPDPQPPAGPELKASPWLAQAPDKYKKDPKFLKDLLQGERAVKSWGDVLDRMYSGEQLAAQHQAAAADLQAKLTAEQARAAELMKAGGQAPAPAPAEFKPEDYAKVAPGKLPGFMSEPAFEAYSKDLSAYLVNAAEEIRAAAMELKVSPAVAQRMVDLFAKRHVEAFKAGIEGQEEQRQKALDRLKREWKGDFAANEDLAARAIRTLGGAELAQEIAAAGFADHPLMIRIFCNIGKVIGEGHMVPGRPAPSPAGAPGMSDRERQKAASNAKRYPTMRGGI